MFDIRTRPFRVILALAAVLLIVVTAGLAEARAGRSGSAGSRGSRTDDAPAATTTAPNPASPMERSAAPSPSQQQPGMNQGMPRPATQGGGFFSRGGFGGALMGGLIGAGIAGMLFGGGFLDGLGSFAGILGFLLQIALVVILVRLAMNFFRNRAARAAYAGPVNPRHAIDLGRPTPAVGGLGAGLGGSQGAGQRRIGRDEIGITPDDFQAFEQLLSQVQVSYGQEDLATLERITTPEMGVHFAEELKDNARRGVINRVSDVRLLQGDLAEAWREGTSDFATVAMRFALRDVTVDRTTGAVVDGHPDQPIEATEIWTLRRDGGAPWKLSAIQQA